MHLRQLFFYHQQQTSTSLQFYRRKHSLLSYFANGTCQRYKDTVYIDSSVTYYSHRHVIYICIAVIPCIFLVIIPSILLSVYPTRLYRFSSRFVSARKRLAITAFTEALNNSFKDGLNGTHDYRVLAGLVLITFPVGVIINFTVWKIMLYLNRSLINAHICFGSSFLIASVRPCKSKLANLSLSYHLMMMGVLGITCYLWSNDLSTGTKVLKYTIIIIPLISHLLVLAWLIRSIIRCIYSRWVYKIIYINTNMPLYLQKVMQLSSIKHTVWMKALCCQRNHFAPYYSNTCLLVKNTTNCTQ